MNYLFLGLIVGFILGFGVAVITEIWIDGWAWFKRELDRRAVDPETGA